MRLRMTGEWLSVSWNVDNMSGNAGGWHSCPGSHGGQSDPWHTNHSDCDEQKTRAVKRHLK